MGRGVIIVVTSVGLVLITTIFYYIYLTIREFSALDYIKYLLLAATPILVYIGIQTKNKRTKTEDTRRFFQVIDTQSGRKCIIKFEQDSDFEDRCREKFGYDNEAKLILELDENNAELDPSCFDLFENNTTIKIRIDKEETKHQKETEEIHELEYGSEEVDEYGFQIVNNNEIREARAQAKTEWTWSTPVENLTSGVEYVRQAMKTKGKEKLKDILEEADKMAVQPLAIAVIGSSGQGKSKLINTLRNLSYGDKGYAETGVIETTMKCTPYYHPLYENIVLWDVPGVGTKTFTRENYATKIDFDRYDFFLICSATRFTDDDRWLLEKIKKREKNCYFVRTKIDSDVANTRMERGNAFDLEELLQKIRDNCHQNIPRELDVFLISSFHPTEYDFQSLVSTLLHDAPHEQRRSLTLGFISVSVEMIEQKAEYLKNEIWKSAALSAVGGVVFIPGFSFGMDMILVQRKLNEYQRQFELTDDDIQRYAAMVNLPVDVFRKQAGLKLNFSLIKSQGINYLVKSIAIEMATEEAARFIPVIGIVIASGMSYRTTGCLLEKILNDCKNDAISVFTTATKAQTQIE